MLTMAILKISLIFTVIINILLIVCTDDYIYPDYIPGYIDRRIHGTPLKYFGGYEEKLSTGREKKGRPNEDILADLIDPNLSVKEVTARLPTKSRRGVNTRAGGYCKSNSCYSCLESCQWLKNSRYSSLDITQYTYLRICSEGCKENIPCLMENYCLPVMQENPDYFVLCVNKCNLFEIIPQVYRTSQCDK